MKKLLLILLCLPLIGFGQGWDKIINGTGNNVGYSVQQTNDGGYIVVGITATGIWLVKTDLLGDTLWTKTYGGDELDDGYSVQQTTDGGYIITGSTRSFGNGSLPGQSGSDVWLIKTDSQGDTLWTKTYGGSGSEVGNSVQQTSDGGYVICGYTTSFGNGSSDIYLIKTNIQGDTLWTRTIGGTDNDVGKSVQQTNNGGYIITGFTESYGSGGGDLYLIKTNSLGDTLWTKTYGGVNFDNGWSVEQTNDLGYIVTGMIGGVVGGGPSVWLVKTDAQGDTLWTKTYDGSGADYGRSVEQTSDGGYVICGYTTSWGPLARDVWLIKTNSQGDTLWTCTYGGLGWEEGWSVKQTSNGGYIIAGYKHITNLDDNLYLIKTDGCGNVTSTFNIPTPSSNRKLERVVDVLGRNTKGTKNEPLLYIYDDGTVEKRIVIE